MKTISDILPVQDRYYVLYNGAEYARHGNESVNGLLVFTIREQAEQFRMTMGKDLPEFVPWQVSAEEFLERAARHGAFCVAKGTTVTVCRMVAP